MTPTKAQVQAEKRLKKLVAKWEGCTLCPLADRRSQLVHLRGDTPANFLFIGEAPGRDENSTGIPFVGRAGRHLNKWLSEVESLLQHEYGWTRQQVRRRFTYAIINTVACMPEEWVMDGPGPVSVGDVSGEWKLRAPTKDEVATCLPRTLELADIVQPKAEIYLGKPSRVFLRPVLTNLKPNLPRLELVHPAYVLRLGGEHSIEHKRAVLTLAKFVEDVFNFT